MLKYQDNPVKPRFVGYGVKLALSIMLAILLMGILVFFVFITNVTRFFTQEFQQRVKNIAFLGSHMIDVTMFERLVSNVSPELSSNDVAGVEASEDFRIISEALNTIRESQPDLILYIYTLIRTDETNTTRFIVDADTLGLLEEGAPDDEVTHFSSEYDISEFPTMQLAFNGSNVVEDEYSYDEAYDVYSFSGYSPIWNKDKTKVLGLLGVDVGNQNMIMYLRNFQLMLLWYFLGLVGFTVVISLILSRRLTRSLKAFLKLFQSAAKGDFTVRIEERNMMFRDEINMTGVEFNTFMNALEDSVVKSKNLAEKLMEFAGEVSEAANRVASATEEQSAGVDETYSTAESFLVDIEKTAESISLQYDTVNNNISSIHDLVRDIQQVIDRVGEMKNKTGKNILSVQKSRDNINVSINEILSIGESLQAIVVHVRKISDQTKGIDNIISAIQDIAEHTSVLSINAAIEATVVGSAGKGFAVVAHEIKKLSDAASKSGKEIRLLLRHIQDSVANAMDVAQQGSAIFEKTQRFSNETGAELGNIYTSFDEANRMADEVNTIAGEQGKKSEGMMERTKQIQESYDWVKKVMDSELDGAEQIIKSMNELSKAAIENSESSQKLSELAQELEISSNELAETMSKYKTSKNGALRERTDDGKIHID